MENKISDIIRASLENVKDILDANTVIGEAVPTTNGTVIIPVSKVSVGIATGGADFRSKIAKDSDKPNNFGGGGGTGVSVTPIAFLIVRLDGSVDLLNVDCPTDGASGDGIEAIASIIRKSPDIFAKLRNVFRKDKKDDINDVDEEFFDTGDSID